jgi:hypothetical protein
MRYSQDPQFPQALDIAPVSADTGRAGMTDAAVLTTPISCIECRRPWLAADERWSLKLLVQDDAEPETVPYCPGCHEREFGGS